MEREGGLSGDFFFFSFLIGGNFVFSHQKVLSALFNFEKVASVGWREAECDCPVAQAVGKQSWW